MIIGGKKQFTDASKEKILQSIRDAGGSVLKSTVSLCHHCHYHVPAFRYEFNNKVYLSKHCVFHGIDHVLIENDAEFYKQLVCDKTTMWIFDKYCVTEVTDRCNLECPHCYHLPDNKLKDVPMQTILDRIDSYPPEITDVVLAGAEASLRSDLKELLIEISKRGKLPHLLTNGVRFADEDFVKDIVNTNINLVINIGLNHPNYINNKTIRSKQEKGIHNINKYCRKNTLGYIGYTMVDINELDCILDEICFSNLNASSYRIRSGSEIGRNATEGHIFVSDLYKLVEVWAKERNLPISIENADNNLYHVMINLNNKYIRLINWCDESNIDMEDLRSGPWCDFVSDGITNFLHQIIRRDVWKNKNLILPDQPPIRYQISNYLD